MRADEKNMPAVCVAQLNSCAARNRQKKAKSASFCDVFYSFSAVRGLIVLKPGGNVRRSGAVVSFKFHGDRCGIR
jgi:hypothetical protein